VRYYQVLIADQIYHGSEALTYSSELMLESGSLVKVPLRNRQVLGIVYSLVAEPKGKQIKPVSQLLDTPSLSPETLELMVWMQKFYSASIGVISKHFLPKLLLKSGVDIPTPPKTKPSLPSLKKLPVLNNDQKQVIAAVKDQGTYILHGETGSGKTRIYIELAYKAFVDGKSSIILTPEIGLTKQLYLRFEEVFGNNVVVFHSHLSENERFKIWLRILKSQTPLIIIGPRSALFSPLRKIGLIVVDESHEDAYKQEQGPYYHTTRVATKMGQLYKATTILGSATTNIVDFYIATQKNIPILRLSELAAASGPAKKLKVQVVDLKDRSKFTKSGHLSDVLLSRIKETLDRKEQSLVFLNRRGTARSVICNVCGWQALCPNCDTPLTYHADDHLVRCHICSYHDVPPSTCPVCSNTDIIFRSIGTKAVVAELEKHFPSARILRFDNDNKKLDRLEAQYENVHKGAVDIIVGTQTLAKGLDLPKLSLVGVVTADSSLYIPDYTAQEKMYQLITQVIGRVGRGYLDGQAVIQTYLPNNPILRAAVSKDWAAFYKQEIAERQQFMFPPFCFLLKISCKRVGRSAAEKAAANLVDDLKSKKLRLIVSDPTPSFHEKIGNKYQWQIIIRAKERDQLLGVIKMLPSGWSYDIDPINLL